MYLDKLVSEKYNICNTNEKERMILMKKTGTAVTVWVCIALTAFICTSLCGCNVKEKSAAEDITDMPTGYPESGSRDEYVPEATSADVSSPDKEKPSVQAENRTEKTTSQIGDRSEKNEITTLITNNQSETVTVKQEPGGGAEHAPGETYTYIPEDRPAWSAERDEVSSYYEDDLYALPNMTVYYPDGTTEWL